MQKRIVLIALIKLFFYIFFFIMGHLITTEDVSFIGETQHMKIHSNIQREEH
jgi:surface polysaccharide O-acyltransferase-like enzyme